MATQCRSSKCTIERKGFRRELDSWRHKLIQCVGFESILEGVYGPRLLQDLSIFDECEPEAVDDWSVDENCSFCNLQLEKLNEYPTMAVPGSPPSAETPPPQGLSNSDKLLCQADQFLYAVFRKRELPQSCDSSIPLVAQELMRRMIQQFALEYATKSQPHMGFGGSSDDSELNHQDTDGPLDLTVSRTSPIPQDGVLDLSKKNTPSEKETKQRKVSERPIRGDYLDRSSEFAEGLLSKALKDIQSGSLDIHKAAILYGIPQKTLLLQTEALLSELKAGEPQINGENGRAEEVVGSPSDARLLQKVAAWASVQSEARKYKVSSPERVELKFPAAVTASSYLHQLTLQRMASQLQDQHDNPTPSPDSPGSGPTARIRIPQVRYAAQPKAQIDLAGLVDAVYQINKASDSSTALHKLKTILPKQSLAESHLGLESRLLQGDLPPLCLNVKNGSFGGSVTGSLVLDCDDDRRDKQPRKKRGRYRQYDHDILEEAIAMVISGKMSVSKAQGIYGVPHSTLEYKVKERTGMLKTPPKKKLRLTDVTASGSGQSGTTTNASSAAYKQS